MVKLTNPGTRWRSVHGVNNATGLAANYPDVFDAIAELDALGHRIQARATAHVSGEGIDSLVGAAMLRRSIMQFVGIRHLLEASAVEPAKLGLRAQFEGMLAVHFLVFGGRRAIPGTILPSAARRESRARYFYVAAERRDVYLKQSLLDGRWGRGVLKAGGRREAREGIRHTLARLDKDFRRQHSAFGPLRCYNKKPVYHDEKQWYSFGFRSESVNSVRALAVRLGLVFQYEMLYSAFSGLTHPRGVSHDLRIQGDAVGVYSPYLAGAFDMLCKWSLTWQQVILSTLARAYHAPSLDDVYDVIDRTSGPINRLKVDVPPGFL